MFVLTFLKSVFTSRVTRSLHLRARNTRNYVHPVLSSLRVFIIRSARVSHPKVPALSRLAFPGLPIFFSVSIYLSLLPPSFPFTLSTSLVRSTLVDGEERRTRVFRKFHFRASEFKPIRRYREIIRVTATMVESCCRCRRNLFLEMSIGVYAVYPVASSNASDVLRLMVQQESHINNPIRFTIGFRPFDKHPRDSCGMIGMITLNVES